jgi:hypothetical protein
MNEHRAPVPIKGNLVASQALHIQDTEMAQSNMVDHLQTRATFYPASERDGNKMAQRYTRVMSAIAIESRAMALQQLTRFRQQATQVILDQRLEMIRMISDAERQHQFLMLLSALNHRLVELEKDVVNCLLGFLREIDHLELEGLNKIDYRQRIENRLAVILNAIDRELQTFIDRFSA